MILNDYQARLIGETAGKMMDKSEFDVRFKAAKAARKLRSYDGPGTIVRINKTGSYEGHMLIEGETFHAIDNGMDNWLICSGKSRQTVIITCNLPRYVDGGSIEVVAGHVVSEAKRRAQRKYDEKIGRVVVKFNPDNHEDARLLEHVKSHANIAAYIKGLVESDMRHHSE